MNNTNEIIELYLDDIIPNRFQPREVFEDSALQELATSIKEHGVIQPIIVRRIGEKYEIIAGERRYKATTIAGLTKIPAIIRNLDDKESSKVALLENLQRRDLNPMEEARTYEKILELDPITQEQLAATMGKSQSAVANKLRLLVLPMEIQDALLSEKISERHARALLNISDKEEQITMLNKIIENKMTVRELDLEIKGISQNVNEAISTPYINVSNDVYQPIRNNIDDIKNTYEDILPKERPLVDLDNLLKKPNEEPFVEQNYKFIPSFEEEDLPKEQEQVKIDEPIINSFTDIKPKEEFITDNMFTPRPPIIEESVVSPIPSFTKSELNNGYEEIENLDDIIPKVEPKLEPSLEPTLEPSLEPLNIPINNNINNTSQAVDIFDLRGAINNTRELIKKIEKSGFVVDTEEMDFEDKYKIIITIDKN